MITAASDSVGLDAQLCHTTKKKHTTSLNLTVQKGLSFTLHEKSNFFPKLKEYFEDCAPTQPPYFCMVFHVSMQKQLELTVIQAMGPNEVHYFHHPIPEPFHTEVLDG